jgi:hypothetical protein
VLLFIRFGQSWPVFSLLTLLAQNEDHPAIRSMILRCLPKLAPHATTEPQPPGSQHMETTLAKRVRDEIMKWEGDGIGIEVPPN